MHTHEVSRDKRTFIHIPGSRLLISSLPDSTSLTHVESLGKPRDSTSVLDALPGKLDFRRHSHSIHYI